MEPFGVEQELLLSYPEEVTRSRHLRPAGILADAGEAHLLFLHVVPQSDVVEVGRDVDQGVGHDRVLVLRQDFVHEEPKPTSRKSGWKRASGCAELKSFIQESYRASWLMKLSEGNIWNT